MIIHQYRVGHCPRKSYARISIPFFVLCVILAGTSIAYAGGRTDVRNDDTRMGAESKVLDDGRRKINPTPTESDPASDFCEGIPYIECKTKEQTDESGILQRREGRTFQATVTGYTSHAAQTDSTPCIAADGTDICKRYAKGEKICATNDWKMGTQLTIEGLGTCTVADRMNKRYTGTGRIDWYFGMDIEAARKWGVRKMVVAIKS